MKKAIFIDLDGTLLTDSYDVTQENKDAVKYAREKGWAVYIITGKSYNGSYKFYKELKLDTTLVAFSGQVHYIPNGKKFKRQIKHIKRREATSIVKEIGHDMNVHNYMFATEGGKFYTKNDTSSNLTSLMGANDISTVICWKDSFRNIVGSYVEINNMDYDSLLIYVKKLNKKYENKVEFAFWITDGERPIIQFKPAHVGKSISMKQIIKKEKIDFAIAIGNGWSDRNMLKAANIGVAMKNASEKVQSYADIVTEKDNNNSGVGKWIKNNINTI